MLNKFLAQILTFSLVFSTPVFAQDSEEAPKYTHLSQGETAPFAGTLFNPSATARLIAEHQFSMSDCDLRVEYELAKLDAKYQLQIDSLKIGYNAQNDRLSSLLEIKEEEAETYRTMALKQPNKNSHWWAISGFVVGTAASIGIFYAATEIAQ